MLKYDSLLAEVNRFSIIRTIAQKIIAVIPENGEYGETSDLDFAERVVQECIIQLLALIFDQKSQLFDVSMIEFFESNWRDGEFVGKNKWLIKYYGDMHGKVMEMEGRKVIMEPTTMHVECADCYSHAKYKVTEEGGKIWYWCGLCHIGG